MDSDRRRYRNRAPSYGVRFFFLRPEGNRQIRPLPPEGTLRLMEQEGFRRRRHGPDSGLSQNGAGHACSVDKDQSPDPPGIFLCMRPIADQLQFPGGEGENCWGVGGGGGVFCCVGWRWFGGAGVWLEEVVDYVRGSGWTGGVLRVMVGFPNQCRSFRGGRGKRKACTESLIDCRDHRRSLHSGRDDIVRP